MYNWQHHNWPRFEFNFDAIQPVVTELAGEIGKAGATLDLMLQSDKQDIVLDTLLEEAIGTSSIEGERLNREDVMSSLKNHLGLNNPPIQVYDQRAANIAKMMIAVRESFSEPLTIDIIQNWHQLLMAGNKYVNAGVWRKGPEPMQVVSGAVGKETIHFEAPPAEQLFSMMEEFILWYHSEDFANKGIIAQALLKSAIGHLYFESIHPFEDGNGRIGRAISEHALAWYLKRPVILYLSTGLDSQRKQYYEKLNKAQQSIDITDWIIFFTRILIDSFSKVESITKFVVKKNVILQAFKGQLNQRQTKVLQKMFDKGPDGFKGGMTAKKYMAINRTSKATATRDLHELYDVGILQREGAGRNVSYHIGF